MKKEKVMFLVSTVMMVIASLTTVYAANYLYNSSDVSYDNSTSGLQHDNVQGAIDELYEHATDYTDANSRISTLETYFRNSPTSYFDAGSLQVGAVSGDASLRLHYNGVRRGQIYSSASTDGLAIRGYASDGTATGKVNIVGDPVQINGTNFENMFVVDSVTSNDVTIAAKGSSGDAQSGTINASKSGYTPLMTNCMLSNATGGSGQKYVTIYGQSISGNNVSYSLGNLNASQAKVVVTCKVLYVKNTAS